MNWSSKYIGRTDMHCWALVRAVYMDHCGIELPTYGELDTKEMWAVAKVVQDETSPSTGRTWTEVKLASAKPLDVLVMRGWLPCADGVKRRGDIHVGVVTRPGHVMHTDMGYAVVEVPIGHPTIRNKIVGCYRHKLHGQGGMSDGHALTSG